MFCKKCGKKIGGGNSFCTYCGTRCSARGGVGSVPPVYSAAPVVMKVTSPHRGFFLKILALALVAFGVYIFFFTNTFKSDEEMIRNRIEAFADDYNSGDFDAFLKNFDKKTRNAIESAVGFGESIFGGATGYGVNYSDLFGLGMALNDGDMMNLGEIQSIDIQGDRATVVVTMEMNASMGGYQSSSGEEIATFEMVKEDSGFLNQDWFVSDLH